MPSYMNRAMQSRDPRFVRVLEKLGHKRPDAKPAAKAKKAPKMAAPREEKKPDEPTVRLKDEDMVEVSRYEFPGEMHPAKPAPDAED